MSEYGLRNANWLLRELGVPTSRPGRPRKLTPEAERGVLTALKGGDTIRKAAAGAGVSGRTVLRIKRKHREGAPVT